MVSQASPAYFYYLGVNLGGLVTILLDEKALTDPYIMSLTPAQRWLYLVAFPLRLNSVGYNRSALVPGIEAQYAGITADEWLGFVDKLVNDGKAIYNGEVLVMLNKVKHNKYGNPNYYRPALKLLAELKKRFKTDKKITSFVEMAVNKIQDDIVEAEEKKRLRSADYSNDAIEMPSQYHSDAIEMPSGNYNSNHNHNHNPNPNPNLNQNNNNQNNNSLGSPPDPPPGLDVAQQTADLKTLAQSVENLKRPRKVKDFVKPALTVDDIKAKFASGEYHTLPDDEYIEAERKAAELEAANRAQGVQKVQAGVDAEIKALDNNNPSWWKTWVKISLEDIGMLQKLHPEADIWRYIKCIARMQYKAKTGKQVSKGYIESCWGKKPWKPEGVE